MRNRYSVLLVVDSEFKSGIPGFDFDPVDFFPGSRQKNYMELLIGFGIPFDIVDIKEFQPHHLVRKNDIRFSSILFTCPVENNHPEKWVWLEKYSADYGISLIVDAFLFSGGAFLAPFGLEKCSGLVFGWQKIMGKRGLLYRAKPYPYSAKGFDLGIRPLLRLITQSWFSRKLVPENRTCKIASFGNGKPAILSFTFGRAVNYFFNFHPSLVLKEGNRFHPFMKNILEGNPHFPSAAIQLDGLSCLRMDDPGSCERVHLKGFNEGVVSKNVWQEIIEILKAERAHLNIAYVPQWVDDGNPSKGELIYRGKIVKSRIAGKHYNSWEVIYSKPGRGLISHRSHDYVSEYDVIKRGVEEGNITILSHGLTHLSTDVGRWVAAKNKYTKMEWYREFRELAAGKAPSRNILVERMKKSSELIKMAFGRSPEIIVPSAHEHTDKMPEFARESGFKMFSSRATAFLWKDRIVSNRKIGAFYPVDMAAGIACAKAGYPIIPVFHDYDIYRNGAAWLKRQISLLNRQGVNRWVSMEELGAMLMVKLSVVRDGWNLSVTLDFNDSPGTKVLTGTIPIKIRGAVSAVNVNGQKRSIFLKTENGSTFFSIPIADIRQGKVSLKLEMVQ
jgi:hypothetical protein